MVGDDAIHNPARLTEYLSPGLALPTDEEWKVLEGAVDSQYGIGNQTWDDWGYRDYDAGTNLKSTSGWAQGGNGSDILGFSGLPGGRLNIIGYFHLIGYYGYWWASTESSNGYAWSRYLSYNNPKVNRYFSYNESGFSVRCLKDN